MWTAQCRCLIRIFFLQAGKRSYPDWLGGLDILECRTSWSVLWALSIFPLGVEYGSADSLLGMIGNVIAPIFAPLGFGTWQAAVAIIAGLAAKEVVVATFGTLAGMAEDDEAGITSLVHDTFTPLSAVSFMAFTLLYTPCFAAIGAIKQETNSYRWALTMCCITLVTGYIVAFLIYNVGLLAGFG